MIQLHVIWYVSKLFISWSFGLKLLGQFGTGNFFWTKLNKARSAPSAVSTCCWLVSSFALLFCWGGMGWGHVWSIAQVGLRFSATLLSHPPVCWRISNHARLELGCSPSCLQRESWSQFLLKTALRTVARDPTGRGASVESSSQGRLWTSSPTDYEVWRRGKNWNSNPALQTSRLVPAGPHNLL